MTSQGQQPNAERSVKPFSGHCHTVAAWLKRAARAATSSRPAEAARARQHVSPCVQASGNSGSDFLHPASAVSAGGSLSPSAERRPLHFGFVAFVPKFHIPRTRTWPLSTPTRAECHVLGLLLIMRSTCRWTSGPATAPRDLPLDLAGSSSAPPFVQPRTCNSEFLLPVTICFALHMSALRLCKRRSAHRPPQPAGIERTPLSCTSAADGVLPALISPA